jgi:hypothetical protein
VNFERKLFFRRERDFLQVIFHTNEKKERKKERKNMMRPNLRNIDDMELC